MPERNNLPILHLVVSGLIILYLGFLVLGNIKYSSVIFLLVVVLDDVIIDL